MNDIDYDIIRSKRKTVGLQVNEQGKVIVRAPLKMSEKEIAEIVEKNSDWIINNIEKQRLRAEKRPPLNDDEIERLRRLAKEILPMKVKYYGDIMGLHPTSLKITSAKTRFGSCSGKNGICFSLYLLRYPEQAVDYVVVHELAHIRHHNHSASFYRLVEQYLPDYKYRRSLLK